MDELFDMSTNQGNFIDTGSPIEIAAIKFCASDRRDYRYVPSGFFLASAAQLAEGELGPRYGCGAISSSLDPFPNFVLQPNEIILNIDMCFGYVSGNSILNVITLYTNFRQFGPLGRDFGCTDHYTVKGYNVVGFQGRMGSAIDVLKVWFERC